MGKFAIGRQRTRVRHQNNVTINVSVKRPVFDRLVQMQQALQAELGPSIQVSVASIVRRIIYSHAALSKLSHRHRPTEPPEEQAL
jgi:hypothetical protein